MALSTRTEASLLPHFCCWSAHPYPVRSGKKHGHSSDGRPTVVTSHHPLFSHLSLAKPTCSWSGIRCDAAGHVAETSLPGAGLNGMLGALSFAAFSVLTKLNLADNITGAIPANATGLTYLDLSGNSLSDWKRKGSWTDLNSRSLGS
ncbi:probable inactive receptor kinase At5g16590 [Panicum virgatum]|uniref:probable inactive receptor kinase At5g16590 n=1 Tax=Panicum virgatum TaxID=38727 RepID=UPI0019D5331B|nr:probable inactive receptor kinase At5g16590 [Panicum virgatum]